MNRSAALLAAAGLIAVLCGVAMVSVPAALIVGGLLALVLAWLNLDVDKEPKR